MAASAISIMGGIWNWNNASLSLSSWTEAEEEEEDAAPKTPAVMVSPLSF